MATYDFERCSVLLVEDNSFVRRTLYNLLRQFKFSQIVVATNGTDAIEKLKGVGSTGTPVGAGGYDLIISDLIMSPMNGLLLLRWVRAAKESPNRFVPFIMVSGAADMEYVHGARDLGMTEFLAKPFSAGTVYKHILEVIDFPRQFVTTNSYFGPDRRRKAMGEPEVERRKTREEDVTIVYSKNKVVKPKEGSNDVWYFRLPNALKEKVSAGGAGPGDMGEIPNALLEEAEEQLERAALDFTKWAVEYLAQLSRICDAALVKQGRRNKEFGEINVLAHELRGQGGTFGYPLLSVFGKMLYDLTGEGCREDDNAVEIVKAHIDSMRVVLREKISGDGGEVGRELQKALIQAIEKYSPRI